MSPSTTRWRLEGHIVSFGPAEGETSGPEASSGSEYWGYSRGKQGSIWGYRHLPFYESNHGRQVEPLSKLYDANVQSYFRSRLVHPSGAIDAMMGLVDLSGVEWVVPALRLTLTASWTTAVSMTLSYLLDRNTYVKCWVKMLSSCLSNMKQSLRSQGHSSPCRLVHEGFNFPAIESSVGS